MKSSLLDSILFTFYLCLFVHIVAAYSQVFIVALPIFGIKLCFVLSLNIFFQLGFSIIQNFPFYLTYLPRQLLLYLYLNYTITTKLEFAGNLVLALYNNCVDCI